MAKPPEEVWEEVERSVMLSMESDRLFYEIKFKLEFAARLATLRDRIPSGMAITATNELIAELSTEARKAKQQLDQYRAADDNPELAQRLYVRLRDRQRLEEAIEEAQMLDDSQEQPG